MVDVGDDDGDDLLQIPVLARCQNGISGSKSWFFMVAAERNSIWEKCQTPDIFRSEGICRQKGAREDGWGGHTTPWRSLAWPAPPSGVVPSWPLSVSYPGSVCLLVK
jgi:hypothetical protein